MTENRQARPTSEIEVIAESHPNVVRTVGWGDIWLLRRLGVDTARRRADYAGVISEHPGAPQQAVASYPHSKPGHEYTLAELFSPQEPRSAVPTRAVGVRLSPTASE